MPSPAHSHDTRPGSAHAAHDPHPAAAQHGGHDHETVHGGSDSTKGGRLALTVLAIAQAMLVLDVTVVNVALPMLSAELELPAALAGWAIAAYAVPFGGLLILGGRIADLIGTRRALLIGLSLFTLASLAAGLATEPTTFFIARAAQGIGAALMSPAALATLLHRFTGAARHRALAVWGAVGGSGAAVGVLLGGLLTGGPGWRWIFFINVPIGVALAIALPLVLGVASATVTTSAPHATTPRRLDFAGALLATTAIASLVSSISVGEFAGPTVAVALAVLGVVLLGLFVLVERRTPVPLVRLGLLASRPVASGSSLMFTATALLVGGFFLFSFQLQDVAGWSPIATGLAFLPISVSVIAGAHLASRFVGKVGARRVAPIALLIAAGGLAAAVVSITAIESQVLAIAGMTVASAGLGATFVCASTTALADVDRHEAGTASGVLNSFHELGAAVGVAALGAIAASGIGFGFAAAVVLALLAALVAAITLPAGVPAPGAARFVH